MVLSIVHRRQRPTTRAGDVCNKIGTYLKALARTTMASLSMSPCRAQRSVGAQVTAERKFGFKNAIKVK
jgi:hypothetical protein